MKRFSRIRIIGPALMALAALSVLISLTLFSSETAADTATALRTRNGLFEVSYRSEIDPPPVNVLHTWVIEVRSADGQPITGAAIEVDGGMKAHGHGLPTQPAVSRELGDGAYLVEGMKFNMAGPWEVRFTINTDGHSDTVEFRLEVP